MMRAAKTIKRGDVIASEIGGERNRVTLTWVFREGFLDEVAFKLEFECQSGTSYKKI